jgi:outer membrane beta-barrel protein
MKRIVLSSILMLELAVAGAESAARAENFPQSDEPIIKPPAEERPLNEARIDTESLELGPYYGLYALDGFGTSGVLGFRLAYHLSEDVFFEGTYGITRVDQQTFRRLTGRSLVADETITYWNAGAGYNLFPGQIFLTRRKTLNSTLYLIGGLGQTRLDQRALFTFNTGTGYKVFLTDWLDLRIELRVHALVTDVTGKKQRIYNLENTAAFAVFF